MRTLIDSPGGSTAGSAIAGANVEIINAGIKADVYIVTSVSAIFMLPLEMSRNPKYEYLKKEVLKGTREVTMKKMFPKWAPLTGKGGLTWGAIWRLITNKLGLGVQHTRHYVTDNITPQMFNEYKQDDNYAPIYVSIYSWKKDKIEYVNLKEVSFQHALNVIDASSYMPFVEPKIFKDENGIDTAYYDGGWIDRNAGESSAFILEKHGIERVISIYHHPEKKPERDNHIPSSNKEIAAEFFKSLMYQQAVSDRVGMKSVIKDAGCNHVELWIDNLTTSFYDVDPTRLCIQQDHARKKVKKILKELAL